MTTTTPPTPPTDQHDHADRLGTDQITAALIAFQIDMPTVHKGKTANVPTKNGGSYSYKYADLADVSAAAFPLLTKHGLSFVALPRYGERGYELVGRLLHVSGQSLSGALPLHGNTAQEVGSALTYARRYLLGCMTGIVTDDDDDAQAAQGRPATRQWDGPTTQELLLAIDEDARRAGATYAQAVAQFCTKRNLTIDDLDRLSPWELVEHAAAVKRRADQVVAEREAQQRAEAEAAQAQQPGQQQGQDDVPDPNDGNDPWAKPASEGDPA